MDGRSNWLNCTGTWMNWTFSTISRTFLSFFLFLASPLIKILSCKKQLQVLYFISLKMTKTVETKYDFKRT